MRTSLREDFFPNNPQPFPRRGGMVVYVPCSEASGARGADLQGYVPIPSGAEKMDSGITPAKHSTFRYPNLLSFINVTLLNDILPFFQDVPMFKMRT